MRSFKNSTLLLSLSLILACGDKSSENDTADSGGDADADTDTDTDADTDTDTDTDTDAENTAPVAVDDSAETWSGLTVEIDVLDNDSDADENAASQIGGLVAEGDRL